MRRCSSSECRSGIRFFSSALTRIRGSAHAAAQGKLEGNGLCCSTRLVKGIGGGDLDRFLVTRRWSCKDSQGKHKLTGEAKDNQDTDSLMRQLFPAAVQQRFPFRQYQSANTGLTDAVALFYNAMSGNGVSTAVLTRCKTEQQRVGQVGSCLPDQQHQRHPHEELCGEEAQH